MEDLPEFPEDIARIIRILAERGHTLTPKQAADAWEAYSETYFAGWLVLPEKDEDVASLILLYVNQPKE